MSSLKVSQMRRGNDLTCTLSGIIDEHAELPPKLDFQPTKITIDVDEVKYINSVGVRKWIAWMNLIPGETKVTFRNVVQPLVEQYSMLAGFFSPAAIVESFYVPYYFAESDEVKFVLYEANTDFIQATSQNPGKYKIKKIQHPETEEKGELDVVEEQYFSIVTKI